MSTRPPFPETATPSDLVGRVLGMNPGLMTGPGTNTYLVGRREPILIDTGAGVPEYVPLLDDYLRTRGFARPSRILLTHRHVDHIGGVAHLRARFPGIAVAKMRHKDASLPEPVDDLRDGQVVHGDGVTLVPVYTPGHASDHLCYYLREERALFTGDVILGGSTTVIPAEDGDLVDYLATLRRLQTLDVRRIYPAHGPVIEDAPAKIQEYIDHRMLRERQILEALGDGVATIPALVARIYVDVALALHKVAALSVESHLKKLSREGRVTETRVTNAPSTWRLIRYS
ncbi:MAG: beta-lactamase-like protein 2 [Candidatus Rokubacteria bacterium]|nr:beta-lactamase-like protein 2 [Candidatus Rokubacteria bacterium]